MTTPSSEEKLEPPAIEKVEEPAEERKTKEKTFYGEIKSKPRDKRKDISV